MANSLINRLAAVLANVGQNQANAPINQPGTAPMIPPQAPAIDPAMVYGQQAPPVNDASLHPALRELQNHFAYLNMLRNQRNGTMNAVEAAGQGG